jgi:UPF0755 protein
MHRLFSRDLHHKSYSLWYKSTFWILSIALYLLLGLYGHMHSKGPFSHSVTLKIQKGESVLSISKKLYELGLVRSQLFFRLYLLYTQKDRNIKKGAYVFEPYTSEAYVADSLFKGLGIYYRVFIPEGFTNWRIAERIKKYSFFDQDKFKLPSEGMLYPDTYKVEGGMSDSSFISLMHENMKKALDQVWKSRASNLYFSTAQEVLIAASLIEKETRVNSERPLIAGVIVNRLKKVMRLQIDPTTIYGITKTGLLGRPLTLKDLKIQNKFNTYRMKGLPETPICNPGKSALEAAANPKETNHIFYVATGKGGHSFAEHYHEHLTNIKVFKKFISKKKAQKYTKAG